jgi:hypothetical protein
MFLSLHHLMRLCTPANVDALITHTLGVDALGWFEVIGAGNVVPNLKSMYLFSKYIHIIARKIRAMRFQIIFNA